MVRKLPFAFVLYRKADVLQPYHIDKRYRCSGKHPERNQNVLGWKRTVTSLPLRFQKLLTIAIAYGQKRDP